MSIARHQSDHAYEYDYDYEHDYEESLGICPPALVAWPRPRPPCLRKNMNMDMHLNGI